MEQLNIEGKRSGDGFVAHKAMLVDALSRTLAERLMLLDFTIGRKGFLGYVKSLAGSNVVKIVPAAVDASESRVNGHKRLKVACGSHTSFLDEAAWVGDKTPMTFAEVRVSPSNTVRPNMGAGELAEALDKVLPFTATDDARPVLACVYFEAGEGKLTLISADGFRLAVVTLDYEDGEGKALVHRDELRGIANALRRAKRARLGFESGGESGNGAGLVLDTELIRYRWRSADGAFPDYRQLVPTGHTASVGFDAVEAMKALSSLKALSDDKAYPVDLAIGGGRMALSSPDDRGEAEIAADTGGEAVRIRLAGSYLSQALKACGGMVEMKLSSPSTPVLFTANGYQLVVMPMVGRAATVAPEPEKAEAEASKASKPEGEPPTEPAGAVEANPEAEAAIAEAEAIAKAKPKRKRKARELAGVA